MRTVEAPESSPRSSERCCSSSSIACSAADDTSRCRWHVVKGRTQKFSARRPDPNRAAPSREIFSGCGKLSAREGLDPDARDAFLDESERVRRAARKIDDPARDEGAAIVDLDYHALQIRQI